MKRALIAGGAGFIGSHLCDLLLSKGYEVFVADNLITGRLQNLATARANGAGLINVDIRDRDALAKALAPLGKFDEIYNLASPASPVDFSKLPLFILETASSGHRNLLDLARDHGARILFASSSEIYGDADVHPQVESYFGNVNTIGHRSCYDEAKRYGEALSVAHTREHNTIVRIVRIFNTYGPRMRPNDGRIIPNFFMQALQGRSLTIYGDGAQTRSFCYVTDQARGHFELLQSEETRPTNIGNPIERTVLEIANTINKITGNTAAHKYLPLPENDPRQRRPDIARAKETVGWEPRVSLEEGLQECLAYFKLELATLGHVDTPNL